MRYTGRGYIVYEHIFPNNKVYIGITSTTIERRWNNGWGYRTQLVGKAVKKYGWENVKHEILAKNKTLEEANRLEQYYIAKFKSANPKYGYNVEHGGQVHKMSYEQILKSSQRRKGDARYKHIARYSRSKEVLAKAAETRRGVVVNNKPIYCEETKKIYSSTAECSRELGICAPNITKVCNGDREHAEGKHFRFLTKEETDNCYKVYILMNKIGRKRYVGVTKQELSKRIRKGKGYKPNTNIRKAIEVFGWDSFTLHVYYYTLSKDEAGEHEKELIKRYDTINNGYNIQSGGFIGFTNPVNDLMREHMSEAQKGRHNSPATEFKKGCCYSKKVRVRCVELNRVFDSIIEAEKELGIAHHVHDCIYGKRNVCGGYHWIKEMEE